MMQAIRAFAPKTVIACVKGGERGRRPLVGKMRLAIASEQRSSQRPA